MLGMRDWIFEMHDFNLQMSLAKSGMNKHYVSHRCDNAQSVFKT